jgi:rhamnogalacturonan endolyase
MHIGVLTLNSDFDRTSRGFALSGPTPFEHGRIAQTPGNLTYTVGESKPSDWYFGQSNLGTWSVKFNLESLPETSTSARLYTSLAGFSSGTKSNILVNDQKIGNISSNAVLLVSSQDTYRGATQAGEWRNLQWDIKKELLKVGENKVDIKVTESTRWRGWLWDSLVLEWV